MWLGIDATKLDGLASPEVLHEIFHVDVVVRKTHPAKIRTIHRDGVEIGRAHV